MTIGCNIWMICLKLNRFFYGLSRMLHLSEFEWTLLFRFFVVFNNFLLIDATARSKISSDQKRFFLSLSLYPLSFFANTPFKLVLTLFFRNISNISMIGDHKFELCGTKIKERYDMIEVCHLGLAVELGICFSCMLWNCIR